MTKKATPKIASIPSKMKSKLPSARSSTDSHATVAVTSVTTHSETPPKRSKTTISAAANGLMAAAVSESTKRGYLSDLRHFVANDLPVPATAEQVVDYLAEFADKLAIGTLERRLISLHKAHEAVGMESPVRSGLVKLTLAGIRRSFGKPQRQAQPLVRDDLLSVLVMVDKQKPIKAARDRALLLVGFSGAFRMGEIVAIQVAHVSEVENGIEVFLPVSKTDQARNGRTVFIPHANGDRCPVRALAQWMEMAEIHEGYIFRAVSRHDRVSKIGLSAQSVALIVKASVERMGGDPSKSSGHSLRAGWVTTAAMHGLPNWQIRETTGHKSDVMVSRYVRPINRRSTPSLL